MNLDLRARILRFRRKATASGSPFRFILKLQRHLRNRVINPTIFSTAAAIERGLSPELRLHVSNLRQSGLSLANGELDSALLKELDEFCQHRLEDPNLDSKKTVLRNFMIQLSHRDDLRLEHILVRFALQESLVRIAASYLGEIPYLSSVQIFQSLSTGNKTWGESQLWHRDYEDSRTVKVWVYLTDVQSVAHGPFTYLSVEQSNKVENTFFPTRVKDEAMEALGIADHAEHVYGPRLTAFYVDSSVCYHMGSRIHPGNFRIVYEATFVTHASLYPFDNGIQPGECSSELDRMVLTR